MHMTADELRAFLALAHQQRHRLASYDEAATKQALIYPVLSSLGWNTLDVEEVRPEYSNSGSRVSFALRVANSNRVFIEVRSVSEPLDGHDDPLLNYSFREGVRLAVLTNGVTWWFYLPLREAHWDQRRFCTIDILESDSNDVAAKLWNLLSKSEIESGNAARYADSLYEEHQRAAILRRDLPRAWNELIRKPDDLLVDLLNETFEQISGFKAESSQVEAFLAAHQRHLTIDAAEEAASANELSPTNRSPANALAAGPSPASATRIPLIKRTRRRGSRKRAQVTGTKPALLRLGDTRIPVKSWKQLWLTLLELVRSQQAATFDKCFELVGRTRPYFAVQPERLRAPEPIGDSGIFVETHLSAEEIAKLAYRLIHRLGYDDTDLEIIPRAE
jgi:hypothetical protein